MMNNFEFHLTTDILFGRNQEDALKEKLKPFGNRILITYGGGSIKKSGLYDKLRNILSDFEIYELSGIEPNPRIESVIRGVELCKEHDIDMILAVGGGSTIDCSKAIAAGRYFEGDLWDMIKYRKSIDKALPIATVLTIAATGSEMNGGGVITNLSTNEKLGFGSPKVMPKISVLNPENTFSVPKFHTACGSVDIITHTCESYFDKVDALLQDEFCEAIIRTVVEYTPIVMENPEDYEGRAQIMWASSWAINGLLRAGKNDRWSVHAIEHELSAYYDITHGLGLAIILPRWLRYILSDETVDRIARFAEKIWGVKSVNDKFIMANKGLDRMEDFFRSLGLKLELSAHGIDDSKFEIMAEKAVRIGKLDRGYVSLTKEDVMEIFKMCK